MKKKLMLVCLVMTMIFLLTSCDPASFYFSDEELKENVVSIELINYDNPEVKRVKTKEEILPFDFDKVEVIEILDTEKLNIFLTALSKAHFHVTDKLTKYSDSPSGISIKINYLNNNFLILAGYMKRDFVGEFTKDGNACSLNLVFATHAFVDLVNKHFVTQVKDY